MTGTDLRRPLRFLVVEGCLLLAVGLLSAPMLLAQNPPPDQAAMLLDSARKGYNDKNYPFAIARFREFLGRFSNHKDVASVRYGLALALLDSPEKDYAGAAEQLQQLAGRKELPEYASVLYFLGRAQRGLGVRELALAAAKPAEAAQHRTAANQRFEEAARQFAAATIAFSARVKEPIAPVKELPADLEWAARARCDQAEMEIRTLKAPQAQATALAFLKDPVLSKSRYRGLGSYSYGFASFLVLESQINEAAVSGKSFSWRDSPDYLAAGRSLSMVVTLNDPIFGVHAHYLLARLHHLADERAEAAAQYGAVLADYDKNKKDAAEILKHPEQFKNDADEKARLEALLRDPPPDYVARASFFWGVLLYESGHFSDALARFGDFVEHYRDSPLLTQAQLRQGFCQVLLKQYADAIRLLQPLADKEPLLADQALFWIAKAQAGSADPANPQAYDQALKTALDTLRRAAEKAQQLNSQDPQARVRRGEILLELADVQQHAHQFKEAAATYAQIQGEGILPQREEEILERQVTALHLAGDYTSADQACTRFLQTHPKSPLLGAVLFRYAENAYFRMLASEQNANLPSRAQELANLNEEVLKRYQVVVERFPELAQVNVARYGLAMALYRKGELDKAKDALEAIALADRSGELAMVPYLLADCLLRLAPAKAEDALAAGQIQEQLHAAAELLDGFVGTQPNGVQTPDALLKLGFCRQRLASLLVQPQERAQAFADARAAYEKLIQQFPTHPLQSQGIYERARCMAQAGDVGGAVNELQRFARDPLNRTQTAPMAILHLATLLRRQNKSAEAAAVLALCRQQNEQELLKDPSRAETALLLQYHHGAALVEAGKFAEARAAFDQVVKQFPSRPEAADAALRWAQSLKEEGLQKMAAARKALLAPNLKPDERATAEKAVQDGLNMVRESVQYLETHISQLKEKQLTWEVRARMLYESAWGYRTLAEPEVVAARNRIQQEQLPKQKGETAPGNAVSAQPSDVPMTAVPLQPSEKKAQAQYEALIAAFADLPLAIDARFELAELHAERGNYEPAMTLLGDALDKEPPADQAEKIHLRLGECQAARGDVEAALAHFNTVAQNAKSPLAPQAEYRAGECLMQMKQWDKAAARLAAFRDQGPLQNLPGLTDRALLRLGHALARQNQWDQSRQALEQVVGRFGSSPWAHEARYGIGWAWQNQKQYDNAVNVYNQVTAETATELGARAQLQIGLCRLEQKRYAEAAVALMAVPYVYDYPELNAAALCEAGRSLVELKQADQAAKLWKRVLRDHPRSQWAEVARERLAALSKSAG